MRHRKSDEVLRAAHHVFLEHGFDAATVDQIATEAGVSKATVYSNFHDKDALLAAMIDRVTSESAEILAGLTTELEGPGSTRERLVRLGRVLAQGVLNPEVIRLRRLAISTSVAFPASATLYWNRGPAMAIAALEDLFADLVESEELRIDDVTATAAQFAYALLGPLQDRSMFEVGYTPSDADVSRYVLAAVDQLLLAFARK